MLGITLHEVSTRFCKSYGAALTKVCEVHRAQVGQCAVGARLHRRGPIGPDCAVGPRSGPDSVGPRQLYHKLAWPSFAGYKKPALSYNMWLGLVAARLPVGARLRRQAPIAPSGPDRAPIAPSGPDRAPIAPVGPRQLYQAGMA